MISNWLAARKSEYAAKQVRPKERFEGLRIEEAGT